MTVSNDGPVTRIGTDSDRPQSATRLISVQPALDRGGRLVEAGEQIVTRLQQSEAAFEIPGAAQQRVMVPIAEANQHGDELPVDQHEATFAVLAGGQYITGCKVSLRLIHGKRRHACRVQLSNYLNGVNTPGS